MTFYDKLRAGVPTLSYEFFPPKNPTAWGTLHTTLGNILGQSLDYVSVTYGAGGTTRDTTITLSYHIQTELLIPTMMHLTCVGHSRDELREMLRRIQEHHLPAVMALRGDPPRGATSFQPHPDGLTHGSELISMIAQEFEGLLIGCASYPEGHIESAEPDLDVGYLKLKQDLGAHFSVTQLFYDNDSFYRFRDKTAAAGVTIPIVAGIMPVTALARMKRIAKLSGCTFPDRLIEQLGEGSAEEVLQRGIDYAIEQCADLLDHGVAGIHLYTLNQDQSSAQIVAGLRASGYFPLQSGGASL